jgi:NAD(P)-dependent dehydrogenase (short-subunit alcohol dehydrogenase family)
MGSLSGRVAIVTGAGRGIGREHALLLAGEGAKVVVNDLGGDKSGSGVDTSAAQSVVDEIVALGGEAVANTDSVSSWEGAQRLVAQAVETFGDLHVLVNNAGILRDQVIVNMSEEDWDSVVDVHLKGHFCPTRHAAAYWRNQSKAGQPVSGSIINTTSTSGMFPNAGQANYSAVKAGIAAFSGVCAAELARYGVRSNAIAPAARTRLTEDVPGLGDIMRAPDDGSFDWYDSANVSPMIAYLATADCPFSGETFFVGGDNITRFNGYSVAETILAGGERWTVKALADAHRDLLASDPSDMAIQRARLRPTPRA